MICTLNLLSLYHEILGLEISCPGQDILFLDPVNPMLRFLKSTCYQSSMYDGFFKYRSFSKLLGQYVSDYCHQSP